MNHFKGEVIQTYSHKQHLLISRKLQTQHQPNKKSEGDYVKAFDLYVIIKTTHYHPTSTPVKAPDRQQVFSLRRFVVSSRGTLGHVR